MTDYSSLLIRIFDTFYFFVIIVTIIITLLASSLATKRECNLKEAMRTIYYRFFGVSDWPGRIAERTLQIIKSLFGDQPLSTRYLLTTLVFSTTLSIIAIITGRWIEKMQRRTVSLSEVAESSLNSLIPFSDKVYKSELLIPINAVFDYLTLMISIACLTAIVSQTGFIRRTFWVLIDIIAALLLAFISQIIIKWITASKKHYIDFNEFFPAILCTTDNFYTFFIGVLIFNNVNGLYY